MQFGLDLPLGSPTGFCPLVSPRLGPLGLTHVYPRLDPFGWFLPCSLDLVLGFLGRCPWFPCLVWFGTPLVALFLYPLHYPGPPHSPMVLGLHFPFTLCPWLPSPWLDPLDWLGWVGWFGWFTSHLFTFADHSLPITLGLLLPCPHYLYPTLALVLCPYYPTHWTHTFTHATLPIHTLQHLRLLPHTLR